MDGSRILVISASMGGGHDGAGRELLRRLRERGHEAQMVDFLDAFPLRIGWLVRFGYWLELRFAPWTYEATYRLWYLMPSFFQPLGAFINLMTRRRVLRWVRTSGADVVVSTYPMASLVLGRARQRGRLEVPVATFITDFAVHPLWTHPGVDLHLCVHEQAATAAAERSGRAATAPGPLVPERFHTDLPDRDAARTHLGLHDDERLVLVVAGAWGIGNVAKTFDQILDSEHYTPLAVCGKNDKLRRRLERRKRGHVFGWTDEMPALMAASDALVQNAGGLTCMEAFAAGLPVVSFEPIAGHGKDNAEQMDDAGVAAFAPTSDELYPTLDRVTSLAGRAMTAKGKAMFAGDAAEEIVTLAEAHAPERVTAATTATEAPRRRVNLRRVSAGAAALAAAYGVFTVGIGTATANGIGVAHPPRRTSAVYVGVRLDPANISDPSLPNALRQANATAIVPGRLAATEPDLVKDLEATGVDMANGGWGERDRLHWGRARSDLMRSPKAIEAATGRRTRDFVALRRVDGFDLATARLAHERVIVPTVVLEPGQSWRRVRAGQVIVVNGRGQSADALIQSLKSVQDSVAAAGFTPVPLTQM